MTDLGELSDREKTSRAWASIAPDRTLWNHPYVETYIARRVGAPAGRNWVQHMHAEMMGGARFRQALSIGCGLGEADRSLYGQFKFDNLLGLDISAGAIRAAQSAADDQQLPLVYMVADLNEALPSTACGPFDMIYAMAAIHHIEDLEGLFGKVAERLMPESGRFWFLEYCGPSRFQWDQRVIEICDRVLELLPGELKGEFERVTRPTVEEIVAHDPSESVRSAEIMGLAERQFDVVGVRDLGFTLAQPLLNPILRHFDDANPLHTAIYRLVFLLEEELIDRGQIGSDTKLAVLKRRG